MTKEERLVKLEQEVKQLRNQVKKLEGLLKQAYQTQSNSKTGFYTLKDAHLPDEYNF